MVDKPLQTPGTVIPFPSQGLATSDPQEVEVTDENGLSLDDEGNSIAPAEETTAAPQDFNSNLAEHMQEDELMTLARDLVFEVDEDLKGRSEWEQAYKDGLKYTGIKEEKKTKPWDGACGSTHPMILEAVVRYQSRALVKLFPSDGPAKLDVDVDGDNKNFQKVQGELAKAQRKFNRFLNQKMPELRGETDRMLFSQAQIGYAVKKVYYHEKLGRVTTQYLPAEHFVIPYGYPNLETCPRVTEIVRKSKSEIEALQRRKFYRECNISTPIENLGEIDAAKAKITGLEPSQVLEDGLKLYEIHVDWHIEHDQHGSPDGDTSPYIITIDESTLQVLSIRRGWREQDSKRRKRTVFIAYPFVPGDGSYAYGYIHLIGQIASSVTKTLRQLVDAGTLSNLPGGFKSKFARMKSIEAIAPAEWRDVDVSPEELEKAFVPLPYKEPSQTLFALMQGMIEEGKSFSSTADLDISASSQNAPVGTTLALLERQTEVSNAIQARLHESFGRELALIVELLAEYDPETYQGIFGELETLIGGPAAISPVGDPTSATMSQRVIQLQSVLQLSAQAPQVFNLPALFRSALTAMGVQDVDVLVPDQDQLEPIDPIQETMALLSRKPVKAFEHQDHDSHLQVHTTVANDPYFQQQLANNPNAPAIIAANQAHIAEHLGFQFRQQVEKQLGVQLPPMGQLPPQIETAISSLVAPAVQRVSQQHAAQHQQQVAQQQAQDPMLQLEQQDQQLKAQDQQNKHSIAMSKLQLEQQRDADKKALELERIASQERISGNRDQVTLATHTDNHENDKRTMAIDIGKTLLAHKQQAEASQRQSEAAMHGADLTHKASIIQTAATHKAQMEGIQQQREDAIRQASLQREQNNNQEQSQSE